MAAVRAAHGPTLILAGAGSGKTRVITERVSFLVSEMGVHPGEILAVTFTNKAADEMRQRVGRVSARARIGLDQDVSRDVRADPAPSPKLRASRDFAIYDEDESVRGPARDRVLGISDKTYAPRRVLSCSPCRRTGGPTPKPTSGTTGRGAARAGRPVQRRASRRERGRLRRSALDSARLLEESDSASGYPQRLHVHPRR